MIHHQTAPGYEPPGKEAPRCLKPTVLARFVTRCSPGRRFLVKGQETDITTHCKVIIDQTPACVKRIRLQSVLVGFWDENQTLQLVVARHCAYHMWGLWIPLLQYQHNLEPSRQEGRVLSSKI